MNGFLVCAQADVNSVVLSTSQALQGIGRIILLLNIFMAMIGAQEIPCFGSLIEDNLGSGFDFVIEALGAIAEVLNDMSNAIPDPDMILTLALGEQRC
jgi:hypothetical protein